MGRNVIVIRTNQNKDNPRASFVASPVNRMSANVNQIANFGEKDNFENFEVLELEEAREARRQTLFVGKQ